MVYLVYTIFIIVVSYNLTKRPDRVLLVWLLAQFFLTVLNKYNYDIALSLGAINLYLNDLFIVFSLGRILTQNKLIFRKITTVYWLIAIAIVLLFNAIRLIIEIPTSDLGPIGVINKSRGFVEIPFVFLYFFSFKGETYLKSYERSLVIASVLISTFFWITSLMNGFSERTVDAYAAFLVCATVLFILPKYLVGKRSIGFITVLFYFLISVVAMRHRSVWIGLFGGAIYILAQYKEKAGQVIFSGLIGVAMVFLIIVLNPSLSEKFSEALFESTQDLTNKNDFESSTGAYRMARWKSRIEQNFDYRVLLFGQGHGYKRSATFKFGKNEVESSTSFHNQYLEQSFRIGLISVLWFLFILFKIIRINRRFLMKNYKVAFNAIYLASLLYGIMYNYHLILYVMLGINLSVLSLIFLEHKYQQKVI